MKILMVLEREFPPDLRVENEIETLSGAGHEIHLACYTRTDAEEYENKGICHIHRKAISNLIYKSSVGAMVLPVYFNFWRTFLRDLFSKFRFDAIHVHDLPLVRVGVELKNRYGCSLTADLHENWPAYLRISRHTKSFLGRLLSPDSSWVRYEREVLRKVDNIIVTVDEARSRLIHMGNKPDKIFVVSNTLNLKHFNVPLIKGKQSGTILFYAGGLSWHRGLHIVIRALALVKDSLPDMRCQILGEGSYRKNLEELAQELGVQDRLEFLGWTPYDKMIERLMQADFTLIPHLKSEHTDSTIPHKLFQYMYAGKPVIASDCVPIKRIINETGAGEVYPSGNPEALAILLRELDKKDYQKMSENGKKWVENKYYWEMDAKRLVEIYNH